MLLFCKRDYLTMQLQILTIRIATNDTNGNYILFRDNIVLPKRLSDNATPNLDTFKFMNKAFNKVK